MLLWTDTAASFAAQSSDDSDNDNKIPTNQDTVIMLVGASNTEAGLLIDALRSHLNEVDIHLTIEAITEFPNKMSAQIELAEQRAKKSNAMAVFWCEHEKGDRVFLYFAAPSGGRILVRRLQGVEQGETEEAVAIIDRSSVEAILAGGRIGVGVPPKKERKVDAPSDDKLSDDKKRSLRYLFDIRLAYAYSCLSEIFCSVHGFQGSFGISPLPNWSIRFGTRLSQSISKEKSDFKTTVNQYPIMIGLSFSQNFTRWTIGSTAFFEIQVLKDETSSQFSDDYAIGKDFEVGLGILAQVDIGVRLAPAIRLFLAPGAEIMINKTDYFIVTDEGRVPIIETWPVRLVITAGIEIAFLSKK